MDVSEQLIGPIFKNQEIQKNRAWVNLTETIFYFWDFVHDLNF